MPSTRRASLVDPSELICAPPATRPGIGAVGPPGPGTTTKPEGCRLPRPPRASATRPPPGASSGQAIDMARAGDGRTLAEMPGRSTGIDIEGPGPWALGKVCLPTVVGR
ncbi:hypothetical protein TsocGM_19545 [Tautonia sociabilis]|uniref:Uncharacterized protein n=1 Tax=Tautonia sociabilis TaxID=2080755 RepID=A0A432MFN3_9BACT|nr:hypothetical protein TsocGM_19545 [Tautonia sociabilis]